MTDYRKLYPHLFGTRNQLANVHNRYQMDNPRVLFVCSAGLLRSATAAHTFSARPYFWNTRTAGVSFEYALNPVTEALLEWAQEVYTMESNHRAIIGNIFGLEWESKITVLDIPDNFSYRHPMLVKLLKAEVKKHTKFWPEHLTKKPE